MRGKRALWIVTLFLLAGCTPIYQDISAKDARGLMDGRNVVVIDVRTPEEFAPEHIEGALNIDYYNETFQARVAQLDRSKEYLVYCGSGRRSVNATRIMSGMGLSTYNLAGGMAAWKEAGLQTEQNAVE